MKYSGVQHHNGIGVCKRYHGPLRTIFKKIRKECPDLLREIVLQSAVKAMNYTMGPEGLVPSLLVYGVVPQYEPAGLNAELPNNRQRHEAIKVAREEFLRISNNLRIKRAIRAKVPESADRFFKADEKVWAFREELNLYVGPMRIVFVDESTRNQVIINFTHYASETVHRRETAS